MKKSTRIAIEVFLPVLIAPVATLAYLAIVDFSRLAVTDVPLFAGAILVVALVPSLAYMVLIEMARTLGLSRKKSVLGFSTSLGAVIGFGFLLAIGDSELWTRSLSDYLFVALLGAGSGAFVALAVSAKEGPNQQPQRSADSRQSSGDSSASETPSSHGPRG